MTSHFQHWPLLDQLAGGHERVHIGFGIGSTAADAESLARRALGRAHASGPVAAAVALADDTDVIIGSQTGSPSSGGVTPESLSMLARRAGLNRTTLLRLWDLIAQTPDPAGITAGAVADHLGVQQRTARRILKRLERAGVAETTGTLNDGRGGRPRTVYKLHL